MSTYLYLKCLDHDPPLLADAESGQHLSDLPDIRADIASRAAATAYSGPVDYFRRNSMRFLAAHPKCRIGIEDEYGQNHPPEEAP